MFGLSVLMKTLCVSLQYCFVSETGRCGFCLSDSVLWLAPCCKPMEKALFDIVFLASRWPLSSLQTVQPLHNNILVVGKVECAGRHSWIYNSVLTADVSEVEKESSSLSSVKRQACVNAYSLRISIWDIVECLVVWQSAWMPFWCQSRASTLII